MKKLGYDHRKMFILADKLGIHVYAANGLMIRMWQWAVDFQPDGAIGRDPNGVIAGGLRWDSTCTPTGVSFKDLIKILTSPECRLLDIHDEFRFVIHGWCEHCEDYARKKLEDAHSHFWCGCPPRKKEGAGKCKRESVRNKSRISHESVGNQSGISLDPIELLMRAPGLANANANASANSNAIASALLETKDSVSATPPPESVPVKIRKPRQPRLPFIAPTVEQVQAYAEEKGYTAKGFSAEKFVGHYVGNGWRVGKNPMVDWKATVCTNQDGFKVGNNFGGQAKLVVPKTGYGYNSVAANNIQTIALTGGRTV